MNDAAQAKSIEIRTELAQRRRILSADQLANLIAPRGHFESEFPDLHAYFFTVDGVLNGRKIVGALFAGEVMLVFAPNFLIAQERANEGLRATKDLLYQEYETRKLRLADRTPMVQGLVAETGGRNAREGSETLQRNPYLKHMLAHKLGGLPWKW